jgi:hypothetical protein
MLLAVMAGGQWVLLCAMQIDGLRPNVRVQYERVSGLDSRIIADALIETRFVTRSRLV